MHKLLAVLVLAAFLSPGCVSQWGVSTKEGIDPKIVNFTPGDGTFENYTAMGRYNRSGLGFGLGFSTVMLLDLTKIKTSDLVVGVSKDAAAAGSNAVINAQIRPVSFYGMIFGMYTTSVEGTGIKTNK